MFIIRTKFYQIKIIKMMKNYDQSVEMNNKSNWSYISEDPYRILITGGSGSGKTYVLLNDQILTKFVYTSKIHSNESINCLLMEDKK